jgi:hypothetical protein
MTRRADINFRELEESIELLVSAYGTICHRAVLKPLADELFEQELAAEDFYCYIDWRRYRDWAWRFGRENGYKPEPCDAWFDAAPRAAKWGDEDEDESSKAADRAPADR